MLPVLARRGPHRTAGDCHLDAPLVYAADYRHMPTLEKRIGLIGAGRMATALARGWVASGLIAPSGLLASDPDANARQQFSDAIPGALVSEENSAVVGQADVLVLATKPQQIDQVLRELSPALPRSVLVVSIAAGVTTSRLAAGLPRQTRIIRVMPNTPCLIGQGASAYCLGPHATAADGNLTAQLLGAVGKVFPVDEKLLNVVTGLSGSGPAYVYTMIEALSDGGVRMGLPPETAMELAAQTVAGAALLMLESGEHPAVLRDRVTSPGGTTIAGLEALERAGFRSALIEAVQAATLRSEELGG